MRVNQTGNNPVQSTEVSNTRKSDRILQAEKAKKSAKTEGANSSGDVSAQISTKGKELARAKQLAASAPDVREEKIAELKKRIAAGKYKVDSKAVADRMVDEHLETKGMG
jgi:negative regulator of flagellin synthesis FlgM